MSGFHEYAEDIANASPLTPKAFANFSPGLELATTPGLKANKSNAESVDQHNATSWPTLSALCHHALRLPTGLELATTPGFPIYPEIQTLKALGMCEANPFSDRRGRPALSNPKEQDAIRPLLKSLDLRVLFLRRVKPMMVVLSQGCRKLQPWAGISQRLRRYFHNQL